MWYFFWYYLHFVFFFFKQKTAYEMRISDWSSDVCSSDLLDAPLRHLEGEHHVGGDGDEGDDGKAPVEHHPEDAAGQRDLDEGRDDVEGGEVQQELDALGAAVDGATEAAGLPLHVEAQRERVEVAEGGKRRPSHRIRSEEHTSELQSLMRI